MQDDMVCLSHNNIGPRNFSRSTPGLWVATADQREAGLVPDWRAQVGTAVNVQANKSKWIECQGWFLLNIKHFIFYFNWLKCFFPREDTGLTGEREITNLERCFPSESFDWKVSIRKFWLKSFHQKVLTEKFPSESFLSLNRKLLGWREGGVEGVCFPTSTYTGLQLFRQQTYNTIHYENQ